jgi:hypothetical protein
MWTSALSPFKDLDFFIEPIQSRWRAAVAIVIHNDIVDDWQSTDIMGGC